MHAHQPTAAQVTHPFGRTSVEYETPDHELRKKGGQESEDLVLCCPTSSVVRI